MKAYDQIIYNFKKRWQLLCWLEILLYVSAITLVIYFLFLDIYVTISVCIFVSLVLIFYLKPWRIDTQTVITYIDKYLTSIEYSSGLLLFSDDQLVGLERLQQYKVVEEIKNKLRTITPLVGVKKAIIIFSCCTVFSILANILGPFPFVQESKLDSKPLKEIVFTSKDNKNTSIVPPTIINQWITIQYPKYTRKPLITREDMDIVAIEGAKLTWNLQFDTAIKKVDFIRMNSSYPMEFKGDFYRRKEVLENSGFYSFQFVDKQGKVYTSDLYSIEMFKDQKPEVKIMGLKQFTTYAYAEPKLLSFDAVLKDDYGISNASIIATVTKGSGESVKFREQKLQFETTLQKGIRSIKVSKLIDLDQMNMEPGDELYFYVEVVDQKVPVPNISRSETYFAVIKDTISSQFAVEGTMGADLMPDYFRSQRQLIIDTEKLLKDRSKLSEKEFRFKSNELGFDQKVLRLKYSEFMGDETEYGVVGAPEVTDEETHDHEEEEDPLAAYTHDHDGDNEHHLVAEEDAQKNPLEEYLHNHDDPEESTLFTQSLKNKLRQALNQMWDAELNLRLYTPKKSLPYQYRALKLLQEIKNSARIYVHRIGFDPPPIKEEKRLSGKLDAISNNTKKEILEVLDVYQAMRATVKQLEVLIQNNQKLTDQDIILFRKAGNELAKIAIENSGKYLKTLQKLKLLIEGNDISKQYLQEVQKGLITAIPEKEPDPTSRKVFWDELNTQFVKQLESYE